MILRSFKISKKCKKKISSAEDSEAKAKTDGVILRRLYSGKGHEKKSKKEQGSEISNSIVFPSLCATGEEFHFQANRSSSMRRSNVHSVDQNFESTYMKTVKEMGNFDRNLCTSTLFKSRSTEDNSRLVCKLEVPGSPIVKDSMLYSYQNHFKPTDQHTLPQVKGVTGRYEEKERALRAKRESLMLSRKTMVTDNDDFSDIDESLQRSTEILNSLLSSSKFKFEKDDVFLESCESNPLTESSQSACSFKDDSRSTSSFKVSDENKGSPRGNLFLDFVNRFSTSTASSSSTPGTPSYIPMDKRDGARDRHSESMSESLSSRRNLFRRSYSESSNFGNKKSTKNRLVRNKSDKSDKSSEESLFRGILKKSIKKARRSHSDGGERDDRKSHYQETGGGSSAPASPQNTSKLSKLNTGKRETSSIDKGLPEIYSDLTRDEELRKENSLNIRIQEAKGIPDGKRYYCVLLVNGKVKNKTSSKLKNGICFWGEEFEIYEYQDVEKIGIRLNKEDRKMIGFGEFKPIATIHNPKLDEWIKVSHEKVGKEKEDVAVRIRYTFRSITILPLTEYKGFIRYLNQSSLNLCKALETHLNAKAKEDFLTSLITILHCNMKATSFMGQLIKKDVEQNGHNDKVMFRANSMATKAIEAYMRLVGRHYLEATLLESVNYLIETTKEFEVDPSKFESDSIQIEERQNNLLGAIRSVWTSVFQSAQKFPEEIRSVFFVVRENMKNTEMADRLISASVFLRLLCPATMSPTLFGLTKEYPEPAANRRLTLVAKTIQTLANFTTFQSKEDYMQFLNPFIEQEQATCRQFLIDISGPSPRSSEKDTQDIKKEIYLGRHLALLHLHLNDVLEGGSCTMNEPDRQLLHIQIAHINDRLLEQEKLVMQRQKENIMKVTSPVPFDFIKSTPKFPNSSFRNSERALLK